MNTNKLCSNGCGQPGPHFVPPSLGEPGAYICTPKGKTKPTPGPWEAHSPEESGRIPVTSTHSLVAECWDEANARLMASAPDLARILSDIIGHGIDYPDLEAEARKILADSGYSYPEESDENG